MNGFRLLQCRLLSGFALVYVASSVRAEPLQTQFERMAQTYTHFSIEVVVYSQPLHIEGEWRDGKTWANPYEEEQARLLEMVRGFSADLAELKPLLANPDARVRTLALGAILQREDGRDLPLFAGLVDDAAQTFPNLHESPRQQGGPRPMAELEDPQTVGAVAQAMLAFWGVPHLGRPSGSGYGRAEVTAQDFADYWTSFAGRGESAAWFAFRMRRATAQTTPIQPQYLANIGEVLSAIRALPEPERGLTELYVLAPTANCESEPEDCVGSTAALLDDVGQLDHRKLLALLEHKPVSEDPAFTFDAKGRYLLGDYRAGTFKLMADFILRHADRLLRPEDVPALLACESAERKASGVDPAWSIAAALLDRALAGEILHDEIAHRAKYDRDRQWAAALWRIRGAAEAGYLVGWFYGGEPSGLQGVDEPKAFLREVQTLDRPDTQELIAALVRDPRFAETTYQQLYMMIDIVNLHRSAPLVDQMGSGRFWMTRYTDSSVTRQMLRDLLSLEFGLGDDTAGGMGEAYTVLRALPEHVPELKLQKTRANGKTVVGFFAPVEARDPAAKPGFLQVQVSSYTSAQEAQAGLEMSLRITSAAPASKRAQGDGTIYRWDQFGSLRLLTRMGLYVIDVTGMPASEPVVEKAFASLVQQIVIH